MQEDTPTTAAAWVFVARSVGQLPDGLSQALRCLARAQLLARDVTDWLTVVTAWEKDFNDPAIARQCMAKAESHAKDSNEWERIADAWTEMGCYPQAVYCHRESIKLMPPWAKAAVQAPLPGVLSWSFALARAAEEQLHDNLTGALRRMVEAESAVESIDERIQLAKFWKDNLQDSDNARRCLAEAEEVASSINERVQLARFWDDNFQDSDNARRCLAEAEKVVKSIDEWIQLAKIWEDDFQDSDNAMRCMKEAERCMEEAEDVAESIVERIQIAKFWKDDFQDSDNARRCLAEAEEVVKSIAEWIQLAKAWKENFQDTDNAIRCVKEAEAVAEYSFRWMRIAKFWKEDLQDTENAIRCVKEAEAVAKRSGDWIEIAKTWKANFQDSDNAMRCMKGAEAVAKYSFDWIRIAKAWKEDLQDLDNAIRCVKEAEAAAKYSFDWMEIAKTWLVDFRDLDSAISNSAIQRVVDAAAREGYFDMTSAAFADFVARDQAARALGSVVDLGLLAGSAVISIGTWGDECASERRPGSYARYFSFDLAQAAEVTINLTSSVDNCLYLMSGDSTGEVVLDENDDVAEDDNEGMNRTDSRIRGGLAAGTYTIEATTYNNEETGAFTLSIDPGRGG